MFCLRRALESLRFLVCGTSNIHLCFDIANPLAYVFDSEVVHQKPNRRKQENNDQWENERTRFRFFHSASLPHDPCKRNGRFVLAYALMFCLRRALESLWLFVGGLQRFLDCVNNAREVSVILFASLEQLGPAEFTDQVGRICLLKKLLNGFAHHTAEVGRPCATKTSDRNGPSERLEVRPEYLDGVERGRIKDVNPIGIKFLNSHFASLLHDSCKRNGQLVLAYAGGNA